MLSRIMYLKNLQKFRKKAGYTQEELAEKSGVSYNTIIKIERGGIENPRIETVVKLSNALKIKIDELVTGKVKYNAGKGPTQINGNP